MQSSQETSWDVSCKTGFASRHETCHVVVYLLCIYNKHNTICLVNVYTCCSNCRNEELPTMTRTAGNCSAHQPKPYFCNMKGLLCQKVSACAAQQIQTARKDEDSPWHTLVIYHQQAIMCKLIHNRAFTRWSTLCCRRSLVRMMSWDYSCCSVVRWWVRSYTFATLQKEHVSLWISVHILFANM